MQSDPPADPNLTRELLLKWHGGDGEAFAELLRREGPWIERAVASRLGPLLRRRFDAADVVQNAVITALRAAPRFVVADRDQFRALVARLAENALREQVRGARADLRDVRREQLPPTGETLLFLDVRASPATPPDAAAERNEIRDWVRLALELLDEEDREILVLRDYRSLQFASIGAELGITENTARMRYARAVPRLARKLTALRSGLLGQLLDAASDV